MGDIERVEVDFADQALIDEVVGALQLPEDALRTPCFRPPVDDAAGMDHGETGIGAAARIENSDPALHLLAVYLEGEVLPVGAAGFAF